DLAAQGALYEAAQLERGDRGQALACRDPGTRGEAVGTRRPGGERLPHGSLRRGLELRRGRAGSRGDPYERQGVSRARDDDRAIAQQLVRAGALRDVDGPGDGSDGATELERAFRRDE